MQQTISVSGMTCEACSYKIQYLFKQIEGIKDVQVDLSSKQVQIESDKPISITSLEESLKPFPKYKVEQMPMHVHQTDTMEEKTSFKPLFIILAFITSVALLTSFDLRGFLHNFMTGFFLVFSFFKLLDVKAFANSFSMYDIVAKRIPTYGYVYPFLELCLGILCLIHFQPKNTLYIADIVIMSIGLIGVLQSVMNKRQIQCACLGSIFNLPMTKVTIIENSIMILVGLLLLLLP